MAERDGKMAQNARDSQSGQSANSHQGDDQASLDQALQHDHSGLAGDIESNRNLSGSSTYETLREQGDLDVEEINPRDDSSQSRRRSSGDSSGGMR